MPDEIPKFDDWVKTAKPRPYDEDSALDLIAQHESGGRNIKQQVVPAGGGYNPSVGKVTGPSTAQGPWQITNSTWRKRAPREIAQQYPTAMSAPVEVQREVARKIYRETGFQDWEPYNASLRKAIARGEQPRSQAPAEVPKFDDWVKAQDQPPAPAIAAQRRIEQSRKVQQRQQTQAKVAEARRVMGGQVDPVALASQIGGAVMRGKPAGEFQQGTTTGIATSRTGQLVGRQRTPQAPSRADFNRADRDAVRTMSATTGTYDNIDPRLAKGEQPRDPMAYMKAQELVGRTEPIREVGGIRAGATAMGPREQGVIEQIGEAVDPYLRLDRPAGVKTDPLRGAASLGLLDLRREISPEERLIDPDAEGAAEAAYQWGSLAPAAVPYVAAGKLVSKIPALSVATKEAQVARLALTLGGVESGREAIRVAQTGEPLNPQEVAISTAIGAGMGGIMGVNPSMKRRIVAAITPQVMADAARGTDPVTAVSNAFTNLLFEVHSGRAPRELQARGVKQALEQRVRGEGRERIASEVQPAVDAGVGVAPEAIRAEIGQPMRGRVAATRGAEAVEAGEPISRAGQVPEVQNLRGVTNEPPTKTIEPQPPVQARAAGEKPAQLPLDVRRPTTESIRSAAQGTYEGSTNLKDEVVAADSLSGGVRLSDPKERARVDALKQSLRSPSGHFERVIVDGEGNVIEGQHRLEAVRELGIKDIPIVRVSAVADAIPDAAKIAQQIQEQFPMRPEQARQLVDHAAEIVSKEGAEALKEYESPQGFEKPWNAIVDRLSKTSQPPRHVDLQPRRVRNTATGTRGQFKKEPTKADAEARRQQVNPVQGDADVQTAKALLDAWDSASQSGDQMQAHVIKRTLDSLPPEAVEQAAMDRLAPPPAQPETAVDLTKTPTQPQSRGAQPLIDPATVRASTEAAQVATQRGSRIEQPTTTALDGKSYKLDSAGRWRRESDGKAVEGVTLKRIKESIATQPAAVKAEGGEKPSLANPQKRYQNSVVDDTYYTNYGEPIKVGEEIKMHFAGGPANMPRPWKLVAAENVYSTVDYKYSPQITVEAANGKQMTFKRANVYSPQGRKGDSAFKEYLADPTAYEEFQPPPPPTESLMRGGRGGAAPASRQGGPTEPAAPQPTAVKSVKEAARPVKATASPAPEVKAVAKSVQESEAAKRLLTPEQRAEVEEYETLNRKAPTPYSKKTALTRTEQKRHDELAAKYRSLYFRSFSRSEWQKAVDAETEPNAKNDMLRKIVRSKPTAQELSDVLDRAEPLIQDIGGMVNNTAYDVSSHPNATPAIKARAQALLDKVDEYLAPESFAARKTPTEPSPAREAAPPIKPPPAPAVKAGEPPPQPTSEPASREPEIKPSKLAQGVEAKAIEAKLTEGFRDLPEYEVVKVADQAEKAAKLLKADPAKATRIAMGKEIPDGDLLPESVFTAVENAALKSGDVNLLMELAGSSSLSLEATGMGQRIRMLGERNPNSPVTAIKQVQEAREAKVERVYGSKKKAVEKIKSEIQVAVKRAAPKARDWASFLDEVACK